MKLTLLRRLSLLLIIIAIAGVGMHVLSSGSALSSSVSLEPELGNVSGPATIVTDATASGGQAVAFGSAPPPPPASSCPVGMGHRGFWATTGFTEDGYNSEKAAYDAGMAWGETDMHFTSDGVPVLMHDDTVDRTTNGTGTIASKTLAQFQALRLNDGEVPPTLAKVLTLATATPGRHLMAEIKDPLTAAQQQTLLGMVAGKESVIYLNGFPAIVATLQALKKADPQLHVSLLSSTATTTVPASLSGIDYDSTLLTTAMISALHSKGYTVRAWTPDTVANWRTLKAGGIDGIITNQSASYVSWVAGGCK